MLADREQFNFRLPAGTREMIDGLRLPRESRTGVIVRALLALQQQQPDHQDQGVDAGVDIGELVQRIEAIEQRLDAGKSKRGPISDRDQRIIALKAEGESNTGIGREVGITEGAVRGVLKKYPGLLKAEIAAKKIIDDAEIELERITG